MANSSVKMTIKEGRITSLIDVALEQVNSRFQGQFLTHSKELIPEGQTGGMVIMEDHPNYWE